MASAEPTALEGIQAVEKERAEEQRAIMKTIHKPMKKWYKTQPKDFTKKHGRFPLFWQDLQAWEHWSDVYKAYMIATEDKSAGSALRKLTKATAAAEAAQAAAAAASAEQAAGDAESAATSSATSAAGAAAAGAPAAAPTEAAAANTGAAPAPNVPPKRKRKSRWGADTPAAEAPRAKSRWGGSTAAPPAPKPSIMAGLGLAPDQLRIMKLRLQLTELDKKLSRVAAEAAAQAADPNRSPSPEPELDPATGLRTNTREARLRAKYLAERDAAAKEMEALGGGHQLLGPQTSGGMMQRKLYIPEKEYPGYNFMGLIIGPRGNTHRKMEADTGCKISIRGRGSVKEGRARRPGDGDDDDDLHVLILGRDEKQLDKAEEMVAALLVPVDDGVNEHKQKQLRELALINGTLREEDYCNICGEKGHRQFECPNRHRTFINANVSCKICGEASHITADCPLAKAGDAAHMDKEYLNFMSELDGNKASSANAAGGAGPAGAGNGGDGSDSSRSFSAAPAPRGRAGLGYEGPSSSAGPRGPIKIENPLLKQPLKDPVTGRVLKPWERPIKRPSGPGSARSQTSNSTSSKPSLPPPPPLNSGAWGSNGGGGDAGGPPGASDQQQQQPPLPPPPVGGAAPFGNQPPMPHQPPQPHWGGGGGYPPPPGPGAFGMVPPPMYGAPYGGAPGFGPPPGMGHPPPMPGGGYPPMPPGPGGMGNGHLPPLPPQ